MTRVIAILALCGGAYYYLENSGSIRLSTGGGGGFGSGGSASGAVKGYSNSAKPAISGIVDSVGG